MIILKKFLRAFISDYLYDREQARQGKLHLFRDVIFHYFILWGGAFLGIHIFLVYLIFRIWTADVEVYQRIIASGFVFVFFVLIWFFAGQLYGENPDRPIIKGVNDKEKLPRWLRT